MMDLGREKEERLEEEVKRLIRGVRGAYEPHKFTDGEFLQGELQKMPEEE